MATPYQSLLPVAVPLYERLQHATGTTAYVMEPTAKGFDLKLDIANAKWWGLLGRAGLQKSYIHHVEVIDSDTYSITDDHVTITWNVGVPTAHYTYQRQRGRTLSMGFGKAYALDDDLKPAEVYNYTYSSEEGRRMIRSAAQALGMKEKWPAAMKVGLGFAVIAGLGALAAVIALGLGSVIGR